MMLRQFSTCARRAVIAGLLAIAVGGCGIKGPLKAPPGKAPPPPPPGVELPSASTPSG
ncbi:MAG TPA: lipoprotein [Casimicrobiaceae bacterium]